MAIPSHLLSELLELPADQRLELASALLESLRADDEQLDDDEQTRLHQALAAALDEVKEGRVAPALPFLETLRDQRSDQ